MSEEQKQSSPVQKVKVGGWKRILGKRWTFPALYMGIAAIILASIMWYQGSKQYSINRMDAGIPAKQGTKDQTAQLTEPQQAVPVAQTDKPFIWPVKEAAQTQTVMNYFDASADKKEQEAALVQYDHSYWPNTGLDIAAKDKKAFDVIASADGKVTKAERDPMLGFEVEVEHPGGLKTVYASLDDAKVAVGDQVTKGEVLGTAGRNVFEKDLGIHLHFEVRKNGEAVQPDKYLASTDTTPAAK
ncbi:M23 family metallopeptidase [Aneurinibacillus terranovensis]|uniref:M23 family metallopeptidase n=1 Tax=Aneurinibacillus terranovensis TaxID=278991 RepID=UPI0003F5B9F4|nr:M23 family metallopeptidase [Aneurinibacillus terranovensis]